MTLEFYETGDMNGRSYVKVPLRSSAVLNDKIVDKYCFLLSILVKFHHCNINLPNVASNYGQKFHDFNIEGFDFTNGFRCNDVHMFEKINNLCINIFE